MKARTQDASLDATRGVFAKEPTHLLHDNNFADGQSQQWIFVDSSGSMSRSWTADVLGK